MKHSHVVLGGFLVIGAVIVACGGEKAPPKTPDAANVPSGAAAPSSTEAPTDKNEDGVTGPSAGMDAGKGEAGTMP